MIVLKVIAVCPACEERVELDVSDPDFKIQSWSEDILLSYRCPSCDERVDREAWEQE